MVDIQKTAAIKRFVMRHMKLVVHCKGETRLEQIINFVSMNQDLICAHTGVTRQDITYFELRERFGALGDGSCA